MDLFEYQGKQYFARYDIPVSPGDKADTVDEALAAAELAGYPVVVKAQVQVGGRGKAGGSSSPTPPTRYVEHAGNISGMDIKGHIVKRLWVEPHRTSTRSTTPASRSTALPSSTCLMLSAEGGVEIETVAESNPDAIVKLHINPIDGLDRATTPVGRGRRQSCPSGRSTALPTSWSSCTDASPRATATWPRSTR